MMARDYRKEHEIASQALQVAKDRADDSYEIPERTIIFKKTQRNGEVRVGFKNFLSGDNFRLIPLREVTRKGVDINALPEYTDFSREYYFLQSKVNELFRKTSFQSRQAVRFARNEYLRRFYEERREIYDSYLSSPEWAAKRQSCYKVHGSTCIDCGIEQATDIHHRHYETLGDEDPKNDIVPLCSSCHELRHASGEL